MDPTILGMTHRLDFSGDMEQLGHLLHAFGSRTPSIILSIRLQIIPQDDEEPPEGFGRFLSSAFPKLSELDIEDFVFDHPSPIFTTSNLTSLKLHYHYCDEPMHTLPEFSDILQKHPNLQELDLQEGALPLPEPSVLLVPLVLPRLVDLRLRGLEWGVAGIVGLVGVSSPLRNIVILVQESHITEGVQETIGMIKEILAVYYGCPGIDHPRTSNWLSISGRPDRMDYPYISGYNLPSTLGLAPLPHLTQHPASSSIST